MWDGKAKLKVEMSEGVIYGLYLYNVVARRSKSKWEEEELSSLGFPPPPQSEGHLFSSEESTTTEEEDPTKDLEPVVVTEKWSEARVEAHQCRCTTTTRRRILWTAGGFALRADGSLARETYQTSGTLGKISSQQWGWT